MEKNFNFKLSQELWKSPIDKKLIFHAKEINEDHYAISYVKGKEVIYSKDNVEAYISSGKWIILQKDYDPMMYLSLFQIKTLYNFLEEFESKHNRPYVIAMDFDNTLAQTKWPNIIKANEDIVDFTRMMSELGATIILWTCRSNNHLVNALDWCEENGIYFDYVNEHTDEALETFESCSNKVAADLYIDDKAYNLHLGTVEGFIEHIVHKK